jgi:HTH-type transcriptional regulator/antitoxin HipB
VLLRTTTEVGLLIRDRRRTLGLTQSALAERVGASREWIRQLESGKPRLELGLTLRAFTALGVSLNAEFPAESRNSQSVGGGPTARRRRGHG